MTHGLQDTPATWAPLLNELRADPEINTHYQFWVFSYPRGYPFPYSAELLREELDRIGRRPIFIATLRAGAGWLFICVARSARVIQIGALRSRLEKQPTHSRQNRCYFGDRTLARKSHKPKRL